MKRIFAIYVILSLATYAAFADVGKIEKLQSEIQRLNKQISELQKTVELQKTEIMRLETLCQENGIDLSPKKKIDKPTQEAISQPIFGIFLGETLDSLKKRFTVSQSSEVVRDYIGRPIKDDPSKIWNVQNDNLNIKQLLVYTFNEKVCEIHIRFTDGSSDNYYAIIHQLEKKYNERIMTPLSSFMTVIDGVEIQVKLQAKEQQDKDLELSYTHWPLLRDVVEEIKRRETDRLGNEF